jgi:phosphatidylinositol alpha-1,6-mannosyltransferase
MNILALSEQFPPAIGGSGELLRNIYLRVGDVTVRVWADVGDGVAGDSVDGPLAVHRSAMRAPAWGLLSLRGLSHHLRQAIRIRRAVRRDPKTVVHCARALPEGVGAWLARAVGGGAYVCWAHGEDITAAETSREYAFLARRVLRAASAVFANSCNTASLLKRLGVAPERVHVIYPGVDSHRFRPDVPGAAALRARLAAGDDQLLLTVGRLQRRKGHDLMLESLARLRAQGRRVRYVIVGDGAERARLESLAASLGVRDAVVFAGALSAEDLPTYFAAADVFGHPNRVDGNDIEGFGIVFLEAAAAALPVIGGASGGVPEAVEDGVTGRLVSGESVDELTTVLAELLDDPDRRRAMGTAGRDRVVRSFSWERGAALVASVHRQIVAAGSNAGPT